MGPSLLTVDEQMLRATEDLYDAEIASLDAELRRMFTALEKRGLLENTIVVVTADHGEEFSEHGMVGHHQSLFEEVIRVPLIVVLPGGERRTNADDIVELTDIAPTLLDLLGVAQPPSFEGRVLPSIRDAWRGSWFGLWRWWASETTESRTAFSELIKAKGTLRRTPHERAAIVDGRKLIVGVDGERDYYELDSDPGERNPASPGSSMRARLDLALEQLYAYGSEGHAAPKAVTVDSDTEERMRALGYAH
jgi:arylsulfatase A-like enzyme